MTAPSRWPAAQHRRRGRITWRNNRAPPYAVQPAARHQPGVGERGQQPALRPVQPGAGRWAHPKRPGCPRTYQTSTVPQRHAHHQTARIPPEHPEHPGSCHAHIHRLGHHEHVGEPEPPPMPRRGKRRATTPTRNFCAYVHVISHRLSVDWWIRVERRSVNQRAIPDIIDIRDDHASAGFALPSQGVRHPRAVRCFQAYGHLHEADLARASRRHADIPESPASHSDSGGGSAAAATRGAYAGSPSLSS